MVIERVWPRGEQLKSFEQIFGYSYWMSAAGAPGAEARGPLCDRTGVSTFTGRF
jgi:hypothetical protein